MTRYADQEIVYVFEEQRRQQQVGILHHLLPTELQVYVFVITIAKIERSIK